MRQPDLAVSEAIVQFEQTPNITIYNDFDGEGKQNSKNMFTFYCMTITEWNLIVVNQVMCFLRLNYNAN